MTTRHKSRSASWSAPSPTEQDALLHRRLSTPTATTKATRPPRPSYLLPRRRSSTFKRWLSTVDIARLTICMLGVQFTWTVELGYGTPYLLSLGIPKTLTPLVWLAGPLSGLIIQPVVGVFSDSLDWKLGRRRPFILIGALLTAVSMYMVAYAKEIAQGLVGSERKSLGGHDADVERAVKAWTIGLAVVGFYCLDFSINAVQASCRSLIMDIPPTDQQEVGNAWSGWMNNLGSVVGFFAGNLDLAKYFAPVLGNSQIKILANLAMIFFITCLSISCLSVQEVPYKPNDDDKKRSVWSTIGNIWRAFRTLPGEIQRICNVQFFAWMGWFPFLFYSTTWVGEILHRYDNNNQEDDGPGTGKPPSFPGDDPTVIERAGSFALLCWAGIAVFMGILLPKLTPQEIGQERWPRNPFTLKNMWTMSLVWFAVCMGATWFVDDLWAATAVIALCGVPWAVAMWVPFAMVGEIISDMKDRIMEEEAEEEEEDLDPGVLAIGGAGAGGRCPGESSGYGAVFRGDRGQGDDEDHERSSDPDTVQGDENGNGNGTGGSLLSQEGLTTTATVSDDMDAEEVAQQCNHHQQHHQQLLQQQRKRGPQLDAGLVLGVHNMYIVFPQFVDAIIASCLFAMIGATPRPDQPSEPHLPPPPPGGEMGWMGGLFREMVSTTTTRIMAAGDPEPVGWVLRFGGIMALVAAYLSRRL
ncbi:hypothetical protein BGX29_006066 [Mortierella sp. GBA35]|nr:hypothetical protein BGX29_006066 [Mortierella sp. GBA35]